MRKLLEKSEDESMEEEPVENIIIDNTTVVEIAN
jgi:hypothetical protein